MKIKIALFVNGWNGENIDEFINGFFAEDEIDLFVFTSDTLPVNSVKVREAEDSIYMMADYSFFDIAIIFGSGNISDAVIAQIIEKCKEAGVPVILQGCDADGVSSITVDSYIGMQDLCEHLIKKHGVKDVAFIAGAADNEDSNIRIKAVKEKLKENGYILEDKNIFYANWEGLQVQAILQKNFNDKSKLPDAIMCANDQMAMFVLLFLEEMGYKVPDDTIVTGFDNLSDGKLYCPSLATVDQCYKKQGRDCAILVRELIKDKNIVKKRTISCTAAPGESCGCFECNEETELRKRVGRAWLSERYVADNLQGREMHLDMCIMSNEKFEDIHQRINEDFFSTVGEETDDFHIYVNPQYKVLEYLDVSEMDNPNSTYSPVMDVICAKTNGVIYYEDTMNTKNLLLGYDFYNKGKIYVFKSIIIDNNVAGYMVMGYVSNAFKRRRYIEFSGYLNRILKKYQRTIDDYNKTIRIKEQANAFLQQTVEALVAAVDAKDSYTNGHSNRVAKYSRYIAKELGMTEQECDDVYLAGLLHDVGKIGIDDRIINKKGKLTDEEFSIIRLHPELGSQILSKIVMSPSLSIGARYHHEKYDGTGYPEKLKGEDIPRIARIIAVADAYDAMTSRRSYRNIEPQMYVREELIKGMGTQFDPEYAKIMIRLLDNDRDYSMKEQQTEEYLGVDLSYEFAEYKSKVSAGIRISECPVRIKIKYTSLRKGGQPTLLFYDSADSRYYRDDNLQAGEMDYIEFGCIDMDGNVYPDYVRETKHDIFGKEAFEIETNKVYEAEAFMVKIEDHFLVKITTEGRKDSITFALYDASRYLYLALTGAYCELEVLDIDISENAVNADYIPRIADKIIYIDGPEGDIPNIQIDGRTTSRSEILELENSMDISFHTMSLPSSRKVWHCPMIAMFVSDDGTLEGNNYREIAVIRLDGEVWSDNSEVTNETSLSKNDDFCNWSIWKQKNKVGVDCELSITYNENIVTLNVENSGLIIENKSYISTDVSKIYLYITGDQCAISNICIEKK